MKKLETIVRIISSPDRLRPEAMRIGYVSEATEKFAAALTDAERSVSTLVVGQPYFHVEISYGPFCFHGYAPTLDGALDAVCRRLLEQMHTGRGEQMLETRRQGSILKTLDENIRTIEQLAASPEE